MAVVRRDGTTYVYTTLTLFSLCAMSVYAVIVAKDSFQRYGCMFIGMVSFCVGVVAAFEARRHELYVQRETAGAVGLFTSHVNV